MRWLLAGVHAVLGIAAVGAGQAFVRDPSGDALGIPADWLEGSPFPDYRVPGLFLLVVIGTANLLSAVLLGRRHRYGPLVSLGTGGLLLAWIAIQTLVIGFRHWSQAIWWLTFSLVTLLAALLARRERNRLKVSGEA